MSMSRVYCQDVTSTDVNDYLKEITGKDITAKDFRTWAGTVLAAMALSELESFDSAAQAKRNLRSAIEKVSARLGNTPTICRKCYVHPEVLNSYMDGNLVLEIKSQAESELRSAVGSLKPEEAAVLAILRDSTGERSRATWQLQLCNEEAVPRERSCKRHSSLNCPTEIAHTSVSYDFDFGSPERRIAVASVHCTESHQQSYVLRNDATERPVPPSHLD